MALIDRIARDQPFPANGHAGHIANHAWSAGLYFFAKGDITRNQLTAAFGLDATDDPQLDQLVTFYQGLTAAQKSEFHSRAEAAGVLLEGGYISRSKYASLLGLS